MPERIDRVTTGKSTAVSAVVQRLNAVEKQTPPPHMRTERNKFDEELPVLFRRLYYSVGNYVASDEVRAILCSRPVVMDRWRKHAFDVILLEIM